MLRFHGAAWLDYIWCVLLFYAGASSSFTSILSGLSVMRSFRYSYMILLSGVASTCSDSEATDILSALYPMIYDFDWSLHSNPYDAALGFQSTFLSKEGKVSKCDCCIEELIKSSYICTNGTGRCNDEMCETDFWSVNPSRFLECATTRGCKESENFVIKSD